ncbi:MAG: HAD family hydrolase [Flavobacteriaceae bacterium]|nr:HAD family hydrolase [Flavobacteriaceae bacterium]|tara:strand:- start:10556 stop:11161 length:606 start_codon:yes stop_codon:yes gene_type:complete
MIKNIIFDLGGVLIDWNPEYVYLDVFKGNKKKMNWFFKTICTEEWNLNQDAGYPLEKATNDLIKLHPNYKSYIEMYYGRWEDMLGGEIKKSVWILKKLILKFKVYALTNWSAETFPVALNRFKFLESFNDIIVSGKEKLIKPDPKIFELAIIRFKIKPSETLFIDDNLNNIISANNMNFITHHFKNPEQLLIDLNRKGIKF